MPVMLRPVKAQNVGGQYRFKTAELIRLMLQEAGA